MSIIVTPLHEESPTVTINIVNHPTPPHDSMTTTRGSMSPIMRFGGPNAVIIADIFTADATLLVPPPSTTHAAVPPSILYLVDTVAIPTRYHLHALRAPPTFPAAPRRLEDAIVALAQRCIAAGSVLVLGPQLQHAVVAEELRQRLFAGGLVRTLVAFDVLKRFDPQEVETDENERHPVFDVTDNFDEMSKRPVGICGVACRLIGHLIDMMDSGGGMPNIPLGDWWMMQNLQRLLDVANAISDQRMLDVATLDDGRVCWLLLGVYSAL